MSLDQLQLGTQNHSQAWILQPTMNSHPHLHQHYCYQLGHQQQQQQQQQQASNYVREGMFEKPLTPSDVGKLNRLVIPKQNAERYFPLDSESGEKGLLLSFEDDEGGKMWKFRYSYWTSSQSYVLTKGWSRFVKEKRLDAGDVVIFQRSGDRLFIGCRRRGSSTAAAAQIGAALPCYAAEATSSPYPSPYVYMNSAGSVGEPSAGSSARTEAGNSRRMLRLFGVNLDCGPEPQHLV